MSSNALRRGRTLAPHARPSARAGLVAVMRACVALVVGMIAATADARSGDVVAAFVSSADLGLWVIGVAVLGLGALVVLESLLSRRTRADADM